MTEAELQSTIVEAMTWGGWIVHHETDSRRTNPGWPDLVAIHARTGKLLVLELKRSAGKTTEAQRRWIESWVGFEIRVGTDKVRVGVVRPDQLDRVLDWIVNPERWVALEPDGGLPLA